MYLTIYQEHSYQSNAEGGYIDYSLEPLESIEVSSAKQAKQLLRATAKRFDMVRTSKVHAMSIESGEQYHIFIEQTKHSNAKLMHNYC